MYASPCATASTPSATIYRRAGANERLPVLFDATPYVADTNHSWAAYFAHRGFVAAAVDFRGRGNSGGSFDSWHAHPHDMTDLVEWFASQPWSDGNVALFGSSYAGMAQWWAAREAPSHLRTIVPIAPATPGMDFPFRNGIAAPYDYQWLLYVDGRALRGKLFADEDFWRPALTEFFSKGLPFRFSRLVHGHAVERVSGDARAPVL